MAQIFSQLRPRTGMLSIVPNMYLIFSRRKMIKSIHFYFWNEIYVFSSIVRVVNNVNCSITQYLFQSMETAAKNDNFTYLDMLKEKLGRRMFYRGNHQSSNRFFVTKFSTFIENKNCQNKFSLKNVSTFLIFIAENGNSSSKGLNGREGTI